MRGFNPRSPCGERPFCHPVSIHPSASFQPTLPLRGATSFKLALMISRLSFQPTLPLRGATASPSCRAARIWFQPTLPLRGATLLGRGLDAAHQFQPTLPLRGATLAGGQDLRRHLVSTHAPLAGSDPPHQGTLVGHGLVSTHAPLAGSDDLVKKHLIDRSVSTHAPLAGSDFPGGARYRGRLVSTHAPLAGSDTVDIPGSVGTAEFQPTLPLRGATRGRPARPGWPPCFNPRSPCGERPCTMCLSACFWAFQPTLPLRGATATSC